MYNSNGRGTFSNLCAFVFGLGPAPQIFKKLLKVLISLMRRIQIHLVIYLDHLLMIGESVKEIPLERDTAIFVLQNLEFMINKEKSYLKPKKVMEFLGFIINSELMTIYLP